MHSSPELYLYGEELITVFRGRKMEEEEICVTNSLLLFLKLYGCNNKVDMTIGKFIAIEQRNSIAEIA